MLDSIEKRSYNQDQFNHLLKDAQTVQQAFEFFDCEFRGIHFSDLQFLKHKFHDCIFDNCQLNNIQLGNATLRSCFFKNSKLLGAQFFKGNSLTHLQFLNCQLDYANFQNIKMSSWSFDGSQLREAEFYHCECPSVNFKNCDLMGARFVECNLESADFRYAQNYFFDLKLNKIKKAKISLPEVLNLLKTFEIEIE